MKKINILVAAGGSGGHIFPGISFSSCAKKNNNCKISFLASNRLLDKNLINSYGLNAYFLSANPMPFNRNIFKWITFFCKIIFDFFKAAGILIKEKINVVVLFGGYSSGAVAVAAFFLRVPIIVHEQNLVPGRAVNIISMFAKKIALSFPETKNVFNERIAAKTIYTGNPLREYKLYADVKIPLAELGLQSGKKTILIMGGSQGSTFLNDNFSHIAKKINDKMPGCFQFIHLTGKKDFDTVSDYYENNKIPSKVVSFLDKIEYAYALATIAVTRAGASALFELAKFRIPMVVVPYPNPKNNQRHNAEYFKDKAGCAYFDEKNIDTEKVVDFMLKVLSDEALRNRIKSQLGEISQPNPEENLMNIVKYLKGIK
ncbi:MAG: undecaprenyldiphospho-muramoylpentapeptide beta-N-acetylglucosaminyltransferase [Candidatus Omnitrophica bacterium]|nr:undecaprenyldiphospho-muramoylpentapeptide beta-N-acetylglucosaminyltransferase [Candidatus Omnitrophota bacterium]